MPSAESFYRPLDSRLAEIRVLHLQPARFDDRLTASLEVVNLDDGPAFSALSYTWGQSAGSEPMTLDGNDLNVLANLEVALRHLRDQKDTCTLWIDAICIDQSNGAEKESQIPLMKRIYSTASLVIIWLGGSDGSIDECAPQITSVHPRLEDEDRDEIINRLFSYRGIVLKPWWYRIWTVQEFVLARNDPLFLCGSHKWPWSRLRSHMLDTFKQCRRRMSIEELATHINRLRAISHLETDDTSNMMKGYAEMAALDNMKSEYAVDGYLTFKSALIHTLRRNASIDRDRIFGITALLSDGQRSRININYSAPDNDVYLDATMAFWNNGEILNLMSAFGITGCGGIQDNQPSWTLNFSRIFPAAVSFVPFKSQPDLWKQNIRVDKPIERGGRLVLQWPGRLIDNITSRDYVSANAQNDLSILSTSLLSIRNNIEKASLRRTRLGPDPRRSALTDDFGERDNFTALLTNQAVCVDQDAKVRSYIGKAWFKALAGAANPHTTSTDALVQMLGRIPEIPDFVQTWTHIMDFIGSFVKYAIGLTVLTTAQGYIGVAASNFELGNSIALLEGYQLPMILRKTSHGAFRIIGFSYIPSLAAPLARQSFLAAEHSTSLVFDIC